MPDIMEEWKAILESRKDADLILVLDNWHEAMISEFTNSQTMPNAESKYEFCERFFETYITFCDLIEEGITIYSK